MDMADRRQARSAQEKALEADAPVIPASKVAARLTSDSDQLDLSSNAPGVGIARRYHDLKKFGHFSSIGVEMAVFLVLGVKAGQWADARLGTQFMTLVGVAFGLFAGFRSLFKLVARMRRESAAAEAGIPQASFDEGVRA